MNVCFRQQGTSRSPAYLTRFIVLSTFFLTQSTLMLIKMPVTQLCTKRTKRRTRRIKRRMGQIHNRLRKKASEARLGGLGQPLPEIRSRSLTPPPFVFEKDLLDYDLESTILVSCLPSDESLIPAQEHAYRFNRIPPASTQRIFDQLQSQLMRLPFEIRSKI